MLTDAELDQLATLRRQTALLCPQCTAEPTTSTGLGLSCRAKRSQTLARERKRRWWAAHGRDWRAARRARAA